MGQKTHPHVIRLGINKTWKSAWYSKNKYASNIKQDLEIRAYLQLKLKDAGIDHIKILRPRGKISAVIYSSKPGVIIGRSGESIEVLRNELLKKFKVLCDVSVKEVKTPMLSAPIAAQDIVSQVEKRIPYRRAVKTVMEKVMQAGAKGVKVNVAGRLNGVEIARSEFFKEGTIPLQTFRSGIDYVHTEARTVYGAIGVNVWIYTGEIFDFDFINN